MSLIELLCASAGLGSALAMAEAGYESYGMIGLIVGLPLGFVIGFCIMALFFIGIVFMFMGTEKFIKYWKLK